MKRFQIFLLAFILSASAFAQKEFIDKLGNIDGVTSVYVSKTMLKLLPASEKRDAAAVHFRNSGPDEMRSLLHALNGGFIQPGPSGDPLRNPQVLPSGRNFYSFDPAKIPTAEAMETGRRLAGEFLAKQKAAAGGYPRSAAIILWAGESIRTDGVNEAMALSLMGEEPARRGAHRPAQ